MLKLEGKIFPPQPRTIFIDFRERNVGRDREREGEKERKKGREGQRGKHQCEKETLTSCLLYVSRPEIEPAT